MQSVQPSAQPPVRVLVVDHHDLFRRGLLMVLAQDPTIDVVGECGTAPAAIDLAGRLEPDLVLLDVQVPGGGVVEMCRAVANAAPTARTLLLTTGDAGHDPAAAAAAGAVGYLSKDTSVDEVTAAIRAAAAADPATPIRAAAAADPTARRPLIVRTD